MSTHSACASPVRLWREDLTRRSGLGFFLPTPPNVLENKKTNTTLPESVPYGQLNRYLKARLLRGSCGASPARATYLPCRAADPPPSPLSPPTPSPPGGLKGSGGGHALVLVMENRIDYIFASSVLSKYFFVLMSLRYVRFISGVLVLPHPS